jgi:hypothetical protein
MTTAKRLEELKQRLLKQPRGLLIAEGVGLGLLLLLIIVVAIRSPDAESDGTAKDKSDWNEGVRTTETLFKTAVFRLSSLEESANDRETLQRIVNHLDQWIDFQEPNKDWTPDAEVADLSKAYLQGEEKFLAISKSINAINTPQSPMDVVQEAEKLSDLLPATIEDLDTIVGATNSPYLSNAIVTLQGLAAEIDETLGITNPISVEERAGRLIQSPFLNQLLTNSGWPDWMAQSFDRLSRTHDIETFNFPPGSEEHLQTSLWLRGIVDWSLTSEDSDLEKASSLFDWTVRNIDLVGAYQLDPQTGEPYPRPLQTLRETLILGRGTRADRAWLFVSLLRRIGIDAAILTAQDPEGELGENALFAVGVLLEGDVYLFEPGRGLPFVAPGGVTLTEQGLDIQPATLSQAISDPSVCETFDVSEKEEDAYPIQASDIASASFCVVLDPIEISHRMRILESKMSGENRLVLTSSPTSLRERFESVEGVQGCKAWNRPFLTACERTFYPDEMAPNLALFEYSWIQDVSMWDDRSIELQEDGRFFGNTNELDDYRRRLDNPLIVPKAPDSFARKSPLRKGRIYYFLGRLSGEESAASFLQEARPPDRQLNSSEVPEQRRILFQVIKLSASYSLGHVAYAQGNLDMAVDCFLKRTISVRFRHNAYSSGAEYNLARTYERQGKFDEAMEWYAKNPNSEATQGGLVRARLLDELLTPAENSDSPSEPDSAEEPELVEQPETETLETTPVE